MNIICCPLIFSRSSILFGISLDKFEDLSVRRLVDAPPAEDPAKRLNELSKLSAWLTQSNA